MGGYVNRASAHSNGYGPVAIKGLDTYSVYGKQAEKRQAIRDF
jgi:hypothetical protein